MPDVLEAKAYVRLSCTEIIIIYVLIARAEAMFYPLGAHWMEERSFLIGML